MTWKRIIKNTFEKDSKAASEALEMNFFHNHLEKALEYEIQDIRFADFGTKDKVNNIAKKSVREPYALKNADGDFIFKTVRVGQESSVFRVSRGKNSMLVTFTFEDDKVNFKLKTE